MCVCVGGEVVPKGKATDSGQSASRNWFDPNSPKGIRAKAIASSFRVTTEI